jgi:hypothetical protein
VPNGGDVTILETSISVPPPSGFTFDFDPPLQQVFISAPVASVENPLVLTFDLLTEEPITIFKTNGNGATTAGDCGDLTPGGSAEPTDPCVEDSQVSNGTTHIVVRTSSASAWNFGTPAGPQNCKCIVKNIFPGGQVANLRLTGKPTMGKFLGAEINAIDAIQGSGLCPDDPEGPYETATASVTFHVTNEAGNDVLPPSTLDVTCKSGIDNPTKFFVEFGPEDCGPDGGGDTGLFEILTSVTGEAGTASRTQKIRCRP